MSEENGAMVAESAVLDAPEASESSSVTDGMTGVGREVSESDIQDLMASAWFDDGLGAVVDADGAEIINKATGKPFKSIEEMRSAQSGKTQNAQEQQKPPAKPQTPAQPQQKQPTQPAQSAAPSSPFFKDGNIDYGSVKDVAGKFASVNYQSQSFPKIPTTASAPAAPAAPESPFAPADALRKSLTAALLEPLERIVNAGKIDPGTPQWNAINEQYIAHQKQIEDAVRAKDREIHEAIAKTEAQNTKDALEMERAKYAAENNVKSVATEFFGNDGNRLFWELVVGKVDQATGTVTERGPAADLVDAMFDAANGGKEYRTAEEFKAAYQNWFSRFASNQSNIRFLCKMAFGLWTHNNLDMIKNGARAAGEKTAAKRAAVKGPSPNGGIPQTAPENSGVMSLWGMENFKK